jgi:hypothetical protein
MNIDDKFGFGAAFLAVGLGAGLILLMTYWPVDPATNSNIFWPQPVEPVPANYKGDPPPKLENLHRGSAKTKDGTWVRSVEPIEATCDWIVFALCVPIGVYFFYRGATSKEEPVAEPQGKQSRRKG